MPTVFNAAKVKASAEKVIAVWQDNPDLKVKDSSPAALQAAVVALTTAVADVETEEKKAALLLTPLRNKRDDLAKAINQTCVSARKSVAGTLGEDSSEYEMVGGTRTSERRRAGGRAKPAATK